MSGFALALIPTFIFLGEQVLQVPTASMPEFRRLLSVREEGGISHGVFSRVSLGEGLQVQEPPFDATSLVSELQSDPWTTMQVDSATLFVCRCSRLYLHLPRHVYHAEHIL